MTPLRLLVLTLTLPACGPHLSWRDHAARAFRVSQRCTQGPLDVEVPAAGARWGERIEVYAFSPRAIRGRYVVLAGDERPFASEFGSTRSRSVNVSGRSETVHRADERPENERCVATADELSRGAGVPTPLTPGATPTAPGSPVTSAPAPGEPASRPVEVIAEPDAAAARRRVGDEWYVPIGGWGTEVTDPAQPAPLRAGTPLRLRVWFPEPNDLEDVVFFLEHRVAQPSVSDSEWTAHLQRRIAERRREDAQRTAESQRRNDRCQARHDDEDCWGPGGYDAYVRSLRAAEDRPPQPQTFTAPVAREPEGPPPAPRAETQPPKPSEHADWVPGYWRWSGTAWGWIAGRWRVPESDRAQGLTVHAPAAPPPPRAEAVPPPPVPGAVWTQGHWQWNGATWVWVAGTWQMPPAAAATWRAPRWILDGSGVRFDPGDWVITGP